jgi:hypothetical protein
MSPGSCCRNGPGGVARNESRQETDSRVRVAQAPLLVGKALTGFFPPPLHLLPPHAVNRSPNFFLSQFGLIAAMHRLIDFLVGSGGHGVKKRARSEFSARRFLFSWSPSASYPALCRSYHHKEMCFQSAAIAFHIITRYRFMLSGLFICNFSWLGGVTGFFPLPSCGLIACHMNASC